MNLLDRLKRAVAPAPPSQKTLLDLLRKPSGPNIIKDANAALKAAGRFEEAAPEHKPIITLVEATPKGGLFSRILKPKKAPPTKEEVQVNVQKLSLALLKEMLIEAPELSKNSKMGQFARTQGVSESKELERIIKIPTRNYAWESTGEYPDLTDRFRRPGGTMNIWPIQNAALHEAYRANGLLGLIAAGSGKTLISLLAGKIMDAKRIVLFVPPQLRQQLLSHDIPRLNQHFMLPLDRLRVIAYSELSSAKSAALLDELKPDLIIADECHNFRHTSSARTKRWLRYMKDNPGTRVVFLSGTITRSSIKDYAKMLELAIGARAPLPLHFKDLSEWAEAIDISKDPMPAGALKRLMTDDEKVEYEGKNAVEGQNIVRSAFRRRLVQTQGVVATEEGAVGTSLVLTGLYPTVPEAVKRALYDLESTWCVAGDELVDILSVIRAGTQISAGFFTRWLWPNNEPDREWLDARSAWNKEMREILKLSRAGLDSPLLVTNAVLRGELESEFYEQWAEVKSRYSPEPPRETIWISDFLVQEAVRWGKETCDKSNGGICWFRHRAIGEAVAKLGGFPFFGGGEEASKELTTVTPKKAPVIVCSVKAHGTGLNLQAYSRNLFTTPLAGLEFEQTCARTHRPGQLADQVDCDIYVHTDQMKRVYLNSIRDAEYVQASSGQKQKLLYSERINLPEE